MIEFHFFFWDANKNSRVAGKNEGRLSNRKHKYIFFGRIYMSKARKKDVARPGLEPRVSRLPCELSNH